MAKLKIIERDLKTVRETEKTVSRRFRRLLSELDYDQLRQDLRAMYRAADASRYVAFYFSFAFRIEDVSTDDLEGDLNVYLMNLLRQRFKGRFEDIDEGEGDIDNFRVFSSVFNNEESMLDGFLDALESFFAMNVIEKFNAETEHDIYLKAASITFKRSRRTK